MISPRFEAILFWLAMGYIAFTAINYYFFHDKTRHYDYQEAKKIMEERVVHDHRVTIYCGAGFDKDKNIYPEYGFSLGNNSAPRQFMDWEHAVPVSEFGKNFAAWREGDPECSHKGRPFKGRKCAELVSKEFQRMAGDMYNLFPAIAAVNQARGNRRYAELPDSGSSFGSCKAKIKGGKFEPPDAAKGQIPRAVLYMDYEYDDFQLKPAQKKLFESWNGMFPVDEWECLRTRRIEKIQGNENPFVKAPCIAAKLW